MLAPVTYEPPKTQSNIQFVVSPLTATARAPHPIAIAVPTYYDGSQFNPSGDTSTTQFVSAQPPTPQNLTTIINDMVEQAVASHLGLMIARINALDHEIDDRIRRAIGAGMILEKIDSLNDDIDTFKGEVQEALNELDVSLEADRVAVAARLDASMSLMDGMRPRLEFIQEQLRAAMEPNLGEHPAYR